MDPEKKVETPPQTPVKEEPKTVVPPVKEEAKASGLDSFNVDQLKAFYAKSPQMFKDAGIVPPEPVVPPEKKPEPPPEPPKSAAPKYGDVEIKLPEDVQVNRAQVDAYLAHAKDIGLDAKQVQAEIDFQTKSAREAMKTQPLPPKVPTPEEIDAENVVKLKAKWGEKFEENMEAARQAAVKFAGSKMLEKLRTSDPDLVEHFYTLAQRDANDKTPRTPNRNGEEGKPEDGEPDPQTSHLKARYNHPSSQAMFHK